MQLIMLSKVITGENDQQPLFKMLINFMLMSLFIVLSWEKKIKKLELLVVLTVLLSSRGNIKDV